MIEMVVHSKRQLMAAIAAVPFNEACVVTLEHSHGKTHYRFPEKKWLSEAEFEKHLKNVRRTIKEIPAGTFK